MGTGRASFAAAAQAGHPNNRKRSLELLDEDVLAKTTHPAVQSRLRTYRALCAVWEIPAFPLSPGTVRCVGASLKQGQYRSAHLYFQGAVQHQVRSLGEEVDSLYSLVQHCIRDVCRSIKRGLGPSQLKDSFPFTALVGLSHGGDTDCFDFFQVHHFKDVLLLAPWVMLREIDARCQCGFYFDPFEQDRHSWQRWIQILAMCLGYSEAPIVPLACRRKTSSSTAGSAGAPGNVSYTIIMSST